MCKYAKLCQYPMSSWNIQAFRPCLRTSGTTLVQPLLSRIMTKPTKWHVRPAKTEISLGIRPVWSESSLCAQWVAKDPIFLQFNCLWIHTMWKTQLNVQICKVMSISDVLLKHSGLVYELRRQLSYNHFWAASWQNQQNDMCAQRRLRSAQADLSHRWAHSHFVGFVTRRLICVLWRQ